GRGEDGGEVVFGAALVTELLQSLEDRLRALLLLHQAGDLLVGDVAGDAVAAKHEAGSIINLYFAEIWLDFEFGAERAADHVAARVLRGLFGGDQPGAQGLADLAVILGQTDQPFAVEAVNAAIAHMRDDCALPFDGQHRYRGGHSVEVWVRPRVLVDLLIAQLNRVFDDVAQILVMSLGEDF